MWYIILLVTIIFASLFGAWMSSGQNKNSNDSHH